MIATAPLASTTRVAAYVSLAELFAEPCLELANSLEARLELLAAGGMSSETDAALSTFCRELPLPEERLTALWAAYVPLFASGRPTAAPPYESYYRAASARWSPQGARAVEATYLHHGLAFARQTGEFPDHVAVECEFLAWLLEDPDRAPHAPSFFAQHLGTFVFAFLDRVEAAHRRFYSDLAVAARRFLTAEQQHFTGGDAS